MPHIPVVDSQLLYAQLYVVGGRDCAPAQVPAGSLPVVGADGVNLLLQAGVGGLVGCQQSIAQLLAPLDVALGVVD